MDAIDKARLLAPREMTRAVELPGRGTVIVRGLTRAQVRDAQGEDLDPANIDVLAIERKILALGLVEPSITEQEAGELQATAGAGELDLVMDAISDLSGIDRGRARREYLRFRDGS